MRAAIQKACCNQEPRTCALRNATPTHCLCGHSGRLCAPCPSLSLPITTLQLYENNLYPSSSLTQQPSIAILITGTATFYTHPLLWHSNLPYPSSSLAQQPSIPILITGTATFYIHPYLWHRIYFL